MNRLALLKKSTFITQKIGTGDSAIYNTVRHMKRMIKVSAFTPYIRRYAEKIISDYNILQYDKEGEVNAIYSFVKFKIRYTKDPHGMEFLQNAESALHLIEKNETPMMDCDDSTILILSLLKSIGYPVAIKATSYSETKKFSHVYGMVYFNRAWIAVDTIKDYFTLGYEIPNITRFYDTVV